MAKIRDQITEDKRVAQFPVIDTVETNLMELLDANSYQKGGFVLHMLRYMLGDSAFFRGLRNYQAKYRNGNALSDDLRRELEATSGAQLGWFFDQWLRKPGFPELTTSWSYDAASKKVTVEVKQGSRFGTYRFPLEIELRSPDGRITRTHVDVSAQASSRIVLDPVLNAAPTDVRFDPEVKLLAVFGH